jgi:opacity protein-like surface antigen
MISMKAVSRRAAVAAAAFAVTVMLGIQLPARADGGVYALVSGDFTWRQPATENPTTYTDWQPGNAYNLGAGYDFNKQVGADIEYSRFTNWDQTTASPATGGAFPGLGFVTLTAYTINLRYEFPGVGPLKPYVGVGAGEYYSFLNGISNTVAANFGIYASGTSSQANFVYQGRVGLSYAIAPHVSLLLGYRFFRGSNLTFNNTAFGTLNPNGATINAFELGAKIGGN